MRKNLLNLVNKADDAVIIPMLGRHGHFDVSDS